MKRSLWLVLLLGVAGLNRVMAQIASFSFAASTTVSGWTNLPGDPYSGPQTVTVNGITISSISAGNWVPNTAPSNVFDGGGSTNATYFPAAVMLNTWLQWNGNSDNLALYSAATPQLLLSGLNPDSTYILRMSGSDVFFQGSTQYTVAGASVSGSQLLNTFNNTSQGVTFQGVRPDASGDIKVYVNATSTSAFAFISGLQVFAGSTGLGTPVVALTAPANGTILAEGGNLTITATASETTGNIAKVEFYADTTKIGEADAAPYTMTWVNPDPGSYQLTAKATDAIGTIATVSVNIGVQSLNYFWSTTGNIATNGDSNFVGTVDSNRLSFRTKNLDRMSISALGNVGIGTDSPTAQLHTTGSVRFTGLASDSMPSRIVVSDSTGKLYYQNITGGGVLSAGPGLGGTSTGIALGDSIPGPGAHSFTSNRYQYLNGYQYSIGGSVNDPVNRPVFRMYDNGDLVASTTMDRSIGAPVPRGLRYYSKLGILQIGSLDRLDTTASAAWTHGGLIMDCEDSASTSVLKAAMYDAYVAGNANNLDSTASLGTSIVNGGAVNLTNGGYNNDIISGYFLNLSAGLDNSIVIGNGISIAKHASADNISGFFNTAMDSANGSFVAGGENAFGGMYQTVSGIYLTNRTPGGATFGSGNVDFSTLPFTGTKGNTTPGLAGYPLFAVGNSSSYGGFKSNALTVLYNGRTQINTTGFASGLTQAQVTPAAALDVVSTNTGVLLPRLTNSQRNGITTGDLVNGLLLYNTDSSVFQYYNGSAWNSVGSGSGGSSGRWLFANGTVYDSLDNIAIGTNNPQGYKLAVNGSAIFVKVVVKPQSAWPDYVFGEHYRLPGLPEVGEYIHTHHHLPGIESAEEVKEKGIDVAEQQAALLQKLEEHTLYLVDQNKQLAGQNQELNDQNTELKAQQEQLLQLAAHIAKVEKEMENLKKENAQLKKAIGKRK